MRKPWQTLNGVWRGKFDESACLYLVAYYDERVGRCHLVRKKVSIVGDSYSSFGNIHGSRNSHYPGTTDVRSEDQMWWGQVIREFGGSFETNRASGGSEFTYHYGVCPSFENYIKNGQLGSPDIILLMGGLNDFWVHQVPESGFRAAVGKLFDCLDSEYAHAEKFVILPKIHNVADFRWGLAPMYRNVIRELSVARGYQVIGLEGCYGKSVCPIAACLRTSFPHAVGCCMRRVLV